MEMKPLYVPASKERAVLRGGSRGQAASDRKTVLVLCCRRNGEVYLRVRASEIGGQMPQLPGFAHTTRTRRRMRCDVEAQENKQAANLNEYCKGRLLLKSNKNAETSRDEMITSPCWPVAKRFQRGEP